MSDHDWSKFVKRVPIKASPEKIYKAWTTQKGLESWFLRQATFHGKDKLTPASANDTYEWRWHGWDDETVERGIVTEANGQDTFGFTFGRPGNVKVTLKPKNGSTLLELTQYDIPADDESKMKYYVDCTKGWVFYLANLKSVLEGGIDLRNKDLELRDVINS